jgi:hypothetical protein
MMAGQGGGHHLRLPRTQRAIEYEVKSFSAMSNHPGINTTPAPICSAKEICFQHQEKVTMQTKIMLASIVVVISCTCAALAGGNGIRDNRYTSTAQYCIPQVDDDADAFRVYC